MDVTYKGGIDKGAQVSEKEITYTRDEVWLLGDGVKIPDFATSRHIPRVGMYDLKRPWYKVNQKGQR